MQFGLLLFLIISASFMEIFSLGALLPFLGVLISPEDVFQHAYAQIFVRALVIRSADELLLPITLLFVVAVLSAAGVRLLLVWASTRLTFATGADLSMDIYRRTLYQPFAVHISRNSSEVISGITTKSYHLIHNAILPALTILSACILITFILFALVSIRPLVSLLAFAGFAVIYVGVIFLVRARLNKDSQLVARESTNIIKALQEGLGGIRDVLIDGSQAQYCQTFRDADLPIRRAEGNITFISLSPRLIVEALGMVLISLLAYAMSRQPGGLATAIPILGVLALGAQRLMPVLQQAYGAWVSIQSQVSSVLVALDLLDQPLPAHAFEPLGEPLAFRNTLEIDHLWFRYSEMGPWVLEDVQLTIIQGERIGFIGTTGSGKSTLLDVVMGLLAPKQGCLRIDGIVLDEHNTRNWQANLAHVPQSIFLADCSVEENIAFGVPREKIDKDRVRDAARRAQIADVIEELPGGYRTSVGERGVRLSGGQRQRIGIARALYKQSKVIILDEATSALDNDTESAVMQAIQTIDQDVTVLMIAHRLSTLEVCSRIVELEGGKVRRIGTFTDIVAERGT